MLPAPTAYHHHDDDEIVRLPSPKACQEEHTYINDQAQLTQLLAPQDSSICLLPPPTPIAQETYQNMADCQTGLTHADGPSPIKRPSPPVVKAKPAVKATPLVRAKPTAKAESRPSPHTLAKEAANLRITRSAFGSLTAFGSIVTPPSAEGSPAGAGYQAEYLEVAQAQSSISPSFQHNWDPAMVRLSNFVL